MIHHYGLEETMSSEGSPPTYGLARWQNLLKKPSLSLNVICGLNTGQEELQPQVCYTDVTNPAQSLVSKFIIQQ